MRHVARQGAGIPATRHCGAYRREDDGSGGAWSGSEAETPSTAPNSRGCQARPRFGSVSGTDRSRGRRVAQDSTPTAYMYTPSGSKDAQIARPAQYPPTTEGRSPRSGCPSRGEYRYPNRGRTLSGKPARHRVRLEPNRVRRIGSSRVRAVAITRSDGRWTWRRPAPASSRTSGTAPWPRPCARRGS